MSYFAFHLMTMFAGDASASSVAALRVPWPERASVSTGLPNPDGKAAAISFPRLGTILVAPLKQSIGNDQRCTVRLTMRGNMPQTVMTMPTAAEAAPDMVPTVCLSLRAFGRVPAPAGTYRIGLIYRAYSGYVLRPDNSYTVPLVLSRTDATPRWRLDEALGARLAGAGVESIPAMRQWLER
jgi:hypothetical protein